MKVKIFSTKVKESKAVKLFQQIPVFNDPLEMTSMMGNPFSRILVIAPPPTAEEYAAAVPLDNDAGRTFFMLLADKRIDLTSMLVVSASRFGKKPSKASTEPVLAFVKSCAQAGLFDYYVIIGSDAFKFMFGHGKKPFMPTLVGSVVHLPLLKRPLFVFPDIAGLSPRMTGDKRTDYLLQRVQAELVEKMRSVADKFKMAIYEKL